MAGYGGLFGEAYDRKYRPVHRHFQSVPNDMISADDAHLFTKSVPLSGPNAVSWVDALRSTAPLLRCDASWARFSENHKYVSDNCAKLRAFSCPLHALPSASPVSPRPTLRGPGFDDFPSLPAELRDRIWCNLQKPAVAVVKAYAYRFYREDTPVKLIIWMPGTDQHSRDADYSQFRDWESMGLYDISQESHEAATREFGRPSFDSLPFRSSVDELRVVVAGDALLHHDNFFHATGSGFRLLEDCRGICQHWCRRCKNTALINNPNIGILLARTSPIFDGWPVDDVPELVVPSAEFLNRIHRVTIDQANRDPYMANQEWPFLLDRQAAGPRYRDLAALLRRDLPSLSVLTLLVEPMRCVTAEGFNPYLADKSHDPATTDIYHAERVVLIDGLMSLVKGRHTDGCDRLLENCRCPMPLPFPKLKRLVVRVDTRLKVTYQCLMAAGVHTALQDVRFEAKPFNNLMVIKKGLLPLSKNSLGNWGEEELEDGGL